MPTDPAKFIAGLDRELKAVTEAVEARLASNAAVTIDAPRGRFKLGPERMAAATPGTTAHEIAKAADWLLTGDALKAAVIELVNYASWLPHSQIWDLGSTLSSDGIRFHVPTNILSADYSRPWRHAGAPHAGQLPPAPRQAGPVPPARGLFSLDGLLEHDTELDPLVPYTNTHGSLGLGQDAAHPPAGPFRQCGRLRPLRRGNDPVRRDHGCELPVVDATAVDPLPHLVLRVADSCTRLDDTLAVASLYRCLVRLVDRSPSLNRGQTGAALAITAENLWRAQRDGIRAAFLDIDGAIAPFAVGLEAVLSQLEADAAALGCEAELEWLRTIAAQDTSADRQLTVFAAALGDARQALTATGDWIAAAAAGTAS